MIKTLAIAALVFVAQVVLTVASYKMLNMRRANEPEKVLGDIATSFFCWWIFLPVCAVIELNEWTTAYVRSRRAKGGRSSSRQLRSGQDNGLYD